MSQNTERIWEQSRQALADWLQARTRRGRIARNTIAIGIVVLDHLREQCPVTREDVISSGGEIKGSRGSLSGILDKYGISSRFLKECTTRQAHQDGQQLLDALDWGQTLCILPIDERDQLLRELIQSLAQRAQEWLNRQSLKLEINQNETPDAWIHLILSSAEGRSGGVVEQHLIGAKLVHRYPDAEIANHPAHAADVQTERSGDFELRRTIYHVTGAPTLQVIEKCLSNRRAGFYPVLLVPRSKRERAAALAEALGAERQVTVVSIEDFVALNIIEMATSEQRDFICILQEIITTYNERLAEVETDMSLQIEIR